MAILKRIFNQGIQTYPFIAHKTYEVTTANYSSSFEISILRGTSPNGTHTEVSTSKHQGVTFDSTLATGSGAISEELNKIPQQVVWSSINSTCFKKDGKTLYPTASIISIPQQKIGLGIKPKSVQITDYSFDGGNLFLSSSYQDDDFGYIYDTEIDTTHFINESNNRVYLGFNGGVFGKLYKASKDESISNTPIEVSNLKICKGIDTQGQSPTPTSASGYGVTMTANSELTIPAAHLSPFTTSRSWGVSMWIKLPQSQSFTEKITNTIINKKNQRVNNYAAHRPFRADQLDFKRRPDAFPFSIEVYNQAAGSDNGKLAFTYSRSSGKALPSIIATSSAKVNNESWHNVMVSHTAATEKTSGQLNFYLNNEIMGSSETRLTDIIDNEYDLNIMCTDQSKTQNGTSGSLDEVRIVTQELTSGNRMSLYNNHITSGSAYQTNNVGYVFHKKGLIVITDPRPKYQNCFLGDGNWNYADHDRTFEFKYKSTKKIEQQSILCEIGKNEFNVSQNNTLRLSGVEDDYTLKNFVTGSDFRPYITSVGLYNDGGELVAIGKLGSPLKKRRDVDVTVDVRLDFE